MASEPYSPIDATPLTEADLAETDTAVPAEGERISKRLARAGLCSRRDAERWIADGRVSVNGRTLDSPAVNVQPGDRILVDGKPVPAPEPTRVWRYNKPPGLVTSARDELGRPTVFENLPPELPRVMSVGRLDLTSEGLLLLTNDGELARHMELPATGWLRRYRVRVHGEPTEIQLQALATGIVVDGIAYGSIEAQVDRVQGSNSWLTVGLREGKNREVRRVMEHLGLPVSRLIRTAYGPFQLGKLAEGEVEEIPPRALREALPGFVPADAPRPAAPARPPRMRYDRLPKAQAAEAPPSATKGGGRGRAAATAPTGTATPAKPAGKPAAKPSAKAARKTMERVLGGKPATGPKPPRRKETTGDARPAGKPSGRGPRADRRR